MNTQQRSEVIQILALADDNDADYVVELLLNHLGLKEIPTKAETLSEELDSEIKTLIRSGNRIGAIKVLRENTSMGLKEAKEAIDEKYPHRYGVAF